MTADPDSAALVAQRDALEADVTRMKGELAELEGRIAKAEGRPPRSNGFVWGLVLGFALVAASIAWAYAGFVRFMGSMG